MSLIEIEVDPSLHADTVVYRTLDFFSASEIVTKNNLMFTRADVFTDKNEGVDWLLYQLENTIPNSGCGMGWNNDETARKHHDCVKQSHYISCWSRNPESVAMWSLYSPDYCSVRVSTTISELQMVTENLTEKYSFMRLTESDVGKRVVVSTKGEIAPVTYSSLSRISNQVSRRSKARHRLANRYARKGESMPSLITVDKNYWEREKNRKFKEIQFPFRLKDLSFKHEEEVRLLVRLGEEKWSVDEQEYSNPCHEYHSGLKEILRSWRLVENTSTLPEEREFVNCSENLIKTVAIDPRCPKHKSDFIRAWFQDKGIEVVKSECFGYIADTFDVYPTW